MFVLAEREGLGRLSDTSSIHASFRGARHILSPGMFPEPRCLNGILAGPLSAGKGRMFFWKNLRGHTITETRRVPPVGRELSVTIVFFRI